MNIGDQIRVYWQPHIDCGEFDFYGVFEDPKKAVVELFVEAPPGTLFSIRNQTQGQVREAYIYIIESPSELSRSM